MGCQAPEATAYQMSVDKLRLNFWWLKTLALDESQEQSNVIIRLFKNFIHQSQLLCGIVEFLGVLLKKFLGRLHVLHVDGHLLITQYMAHADLFVSLNELLAVRCT